MVEFVYEVAGQEFENGSAPFGEGFKWAVAMEKKTGCEVHRYKFKNGELVAYQKLVNDNVFVNAN